VVMREEYTAPRFERERVMLRRKAERDSNGQPWAIFVIKQRIQGTKTALKTIPKDALTVNDKIKHNNMSKQPMSTVDYYKLDLILQEICDIFDTEPEKLKAKCKKTEVIRLRHLHFYVTTTILKGKLPIKTIASHMGHRDHTSAINGRDVVKNYIKNKDPFFIDHWLEYESKSQIWKSYLAA